jgi:dephospho-CoA kinase
MRLLGLTGGVGMGKSTSARLLAERGIEIIDTDLVARELVAPGQPALSEITSRFGSEMVGPDGHLRRSALAEKVFASPEKLKELEAILHPRIRERWMKQVEDWRGEKRETAAVVIPLLFETDAQAQFNAIICVACSTMTQLERLRARGWPEDQIQRRKAAQWPVEKKMAGSNYVVWTEGDLAVHARQIDRILDGYFTAPLIPTRGN